MGTLIQAVIGLLSGGTGQAVGRTVTNVATIGSLVVALTPVVYTFDKRKDDVMVSVTYGEFLFWGTLIGVIVVLVLKLAHYTPPPQG